MVDSPKPVQSTLAYQDNDIAHEPPQALEEHPANQEIYVNDDLDENFIESIEKNGVLEPLVITTGKRIISGHRRRRAARQVGLDEIPVRYVEFENEADEVKALVDFNRQRDKTKGEIIREGEAYLEAKKRENKEKRLEGNRRGGMKSPGDGEDKSSPHGEKTSNNSDSYEDAAETVGVGKNSLYRGVSVLKTAQGDEEEDPDVQEVAEQEMEKLDNDDQSYRGASENVEATRELRQLSSAEDQIVCEVASEHLQRVKNGDREARRAIKEAKKQIKKRQHERELAQQEPTLKGDTEFDIIVADPPWDYNNDEWRETYQGTVPYPTMSLDELKAVDVPAADDSVLWLWFTNAFVAEAAELAKSWGFDQKTILTWDKERLGLGHWLRNRTEHVMFCVRGSPTVDYNNQPTIFSEQSGDHSVKPDSFYQIVEDGCHGSKLELFAREARDGWVAFGDEVQKEANQAVVADD